MTLDHSEYLRLHSEIWNWLNSHTLTLQDYEFLLQSCQIELKMLEKKVAQLKKK